MTYSTSLNWVIYDEPEMPMAGDVERERYVVVVVYVSG